VRDFQTRVGLEVDGVAGEDTLGALRRNKKPRRR
jgi:murein L,D-transpeptidase YcbB/YkuD